MRSNSHVRSTSAWLASFVVAAGYPAFCSNPPAHVTLLVDFAEPVEDQLVKQVHQETDEVLKVAGVEPEWLKYDLNRQEWIEGEVAVVKFRGVCAPGKGRRAGLTSGALAWAHSVDGHILPFVDVECDRVADYIRTKTDRTGALNRPVMLARALGRVLAHELYHVLASTSRHESWGITKSVLTADELVDQTVTMHPKSVQFLRDRLFPPPRMADILSGGR